MRRKGIILLCALAALAAGAYLLWPRGPAEPVYQGKGLSQWLEDARIRPYPSGCEQAEQAVRAAGPKALPWLMSELIRRESKWHATLHDWTDRIARRSPTQNAERYRSWNAAVGLRLLGPGAAPALPELDRYLYFGDQMLSGRAAHAMAGGGEAAIPYLLRGMNSTNPWIQRVCMDGLGYLAHTTAAATPHLVQMLQSTDRQARKTAAVHLWDVTSYPELTIPALTVALRDSDAEVRDFVTNTLTHLRGNSAPLVAELRRLMAGTNAVLAVTASNALHLLEITDALPLRP